MYPTRADLVAASDVDALTGGTATQQQGWYDASKRLIEAFCGQRFDSEVLTLRLDGTGDRRLPLPRRLAVLDSIESVGSSLDAADLELTASHNALIVKPSAWGGGNWAERALREGEPTSFRRGFGTVEITGEWGWSDAEQDGSPDSALGVAMRLDMEDQALASLHGLANTVRAASRLGLKNVNQGSLSATIERPDVPLSSEVQQILEANGFVWQPVAVVA